MWPFSLPVLTPTYIYIFDVKLITNVWIQTTWSKEEDVSQSEGLVPGGIEATFDGPGLLLALALGIRNKFELHIGIWQTVGVHGHQVSSLFDCGGGV